jgi:hypothetical protein
MKDEVGFGCYTFIVNKTSGTRRKNAFIFTNLSSGGVSYGGIIS